MFSFEYKKFGNLLKECNNHAQITIKNFSKRVSLKTTIRWQQQNVY